MMQRVIFWALWWAGLVALWLLLVDTLEWPEVAAGAGAAAIGATAATIVRAHRHAPGRPRLRWLLQTWRLPWRVLRDSTIVLAALWRHVALRQPVHGLWRTVRVAPGGDDPASVAYRAFTVAATSIAPNTYVIGIDRERGEVLVHQLIPSDAIALKDSVTGTS